MYSLGDPGCWGFAAFRQIEDAILSPVHLPEPKLMCDSDKLTLLELLKEALILWPCRSLAKTCPCFQSWDVG